MQNDSVEALRKAVEHMHGARAAFVISTPVHERHMGKTVWEGVVSIFALAGDPPQVCYAWKVPAEKGGKDRFYTVLKTPEIDSPEKAVRASIVADSKAGRSQ